LCDQIGTQAANNNTCSKGNIKDLSHFGLLVDSSFLVSKILYIN